MARVRGRQLLADLGHLGVGVVVVGVVVSGGVSPVPDVGWTPRDFWERNPDLNPATIFGKT